MKKTAIIHISVLLVLLIIAVGTFDFELHPDETSRIKAQTENVMGSIESPKPLEKLEKPLGERPENGWFFGFSGVESEIGYYSKLENYLEGYIKEAGDRLMTVHCKDDSRLQAEELLEMADKGVQAIFLVPIDMQKLQPTLRKLKERNIPVIVMNQEVGEIEDVVSVVASDNFNSGFILGDYMVNHCKPGRDLYHKAKVIIFSEKSHNFGLQKSYGFRIGSGDSLFQVEREVKCSHDKEEIRKELKAAVEEIEDLNYVFSICDEMTLSILEICEEEHYDYLQVFTTGGSPAIKRQLQRDNKNLAAFAAESPISLGMNAYGVMYQYLDGQKVKKQYLVETFLVTRENLSDYSVNIWQ